MARQASVLSLETDEWGCRVYFEKKSRLSGHHRVAVGQSTLPPPLVRAAAVLPAGVYVTYELAGSARLRLVEAPSAAGNKRGFPPRPVISGVFFD